MINSENLERLMQIRYRDRQDWGVQEIDRYLLSLDIEMSDSAIRVTSPETWSKVKLIVRKCKQCEANGHMESPSAIKGSVNGKMECFWICGCGQKTTLHQGRYALPEAIAEWNWMMK